MVPEYKIECVSGRKLSRLGAKRWWSRIVHRNEQVLYTSELYSSSQARDDTAKRLAECLGLEIHWLNE